MADTVEFKLGKKAPVIDERTLKLATYIDQAVLPTPPETFIQTTQQSGWGMLGNDTHGDCTCAALGHMTQLWTGKTPSDAEVLALYDRVNGGQDAGADMMNVLKTFRKHPYSEEGEYAFAAIDFTNPLAIKQAIMLFGGVYLGLALPRSAQQQVGGVWDVTGDAAGSWGGHAVNIVNYSPGVLNLVTWGNIQNMTWDFLHVYADEAFAIIPSSYVKNPPKGFDLKTLHADLKELIKEKGGK